MGEVVGAGLLAQVPTIMLLEETRGELDNGEDFTLAGALEYLCADSRLTRTAQPQNPQ